MSMNLLNLKFLAEIIWTANCFIPSVIKHTLPPDVSVLQVSGAGSPHLAQDSF